MSVLLLIARAFLATWTSVFAYVLLGTYVGDRRVVASISATIADAGRDRADLGGACWVIYVSTLGAGGSLIEVALAVGLSGVRLLPMVVLMLPMIKRRTPQLEAGAARAPRR